MLDAVTVTASDFGASSAFYDAVFAALGWSRTAELVDEEEDDAAIEALGWGPTGTTPQFWLVHGAVVTSGLHVTFRAESPVEVETFAHAIGQTRGDIVSPPRRWTVFRRGEFGATVRDPDGNLVEAVAPE